LKIFPVFLAVFLLLLPMTAQGGIDLGGGGGESDGGDSSDGGGGGGGSKKLTVDAFKRYLEDWQERQPDKYEEIRDLLYKEPYTTENYVSPSVWVYYEPKNNKTVYRSDEIEIGAYVQNENPIEIRRALYLYLEVKGPKDEAFKPAKAERQIIQVNEYSENNNSIRIFPDISSLGYMKDEGEVQFRIGISDGTKRDGGWYTTDMPDYPKSGYYGVLDLYVYNNPPAINNSTMRVSPDPVMWNDLVTYKADLTDRDLDEVNVTLYIYRNESINDSTTSNHANNNVSAQNDEAIFCTSKFFPANEKERTVTFSIQGSDVFDKDKDPGKNFTYKISSNDSINSTWSLMARGPQLKEISGITVEPGLLECEDNNYFWWNKYTFTIKVRSLTPYEKMVTVGMFTKTAEDKEAKQPCEPMTLQVTKDNDTIFRFRDVRPFDVTDADQSFSYYFTYDVPDQHGDEITEITEGSKSINPKVMRYPMLSLVTLSNLALIFLISLIGGILMEQKLFRRW
jgi:hypothetical protein